MELKILHNPVDRTAGTGLLRRVLSAEPLASIVLKGMTSTACSGADGDVVLAVPDCWECSSLEKFSSVKCYNSTGPLTCDYVKAPSSDWLVISNGRFLTALQDELLLKTLAGTDADAVAVNVKSSIRPYTEQVKLTPDRRVVGFRRIYDDNVQPAYIFDDWPHHLFIRSSVFDIAIPQDCEMPGFRKFRSGLKEKGLRLSAVDISGSVLDLESEQDLLAFITDRIDSNGSYSCHSASFGDNVRFFGNAAMGKDVKIGPDAVIAGPTVLGSNVTVGRGAVLEKSVVLPGVTIPDNAVIRTALVTSDPDSDCRIRGVDVHNAVVGDYATREKRAFRLWPILSYPRFCKRIFDIMFSLVILTLFLPAFVIIGAIIKLTSKGPIFYSAKRQGVHGKVFGCLKFRSMMTCAEEMQEQLRFVNQVDGPQFKMENDPRVTGVGRFLRATSIDEIPQFINVLLGQMSVVGPRPSPDDENQSCPRWRQARLSVRPGITGLWQISRTREESKDFQEWLHYDVEYVKQLSFMFDVQIAFKTAQKLINDFVDQF